MDEAALLAQCTFTDDNCLRFNLYILDYCNKRGYTGTAHELQREAGIDPGSVPPIDARQGLLFECVLFSNVFERYDWAVPRRILGAVKLGMVIRGGARSPGKITWIGLVSVSVCRCSLGLAAARRLGRARRSHAPFTAFHPLPVRVFGGVRVNNA